MVPPRPAHVAFAVPSRSGTVGFPFLESFAAALETLRHLRIEYSLLLHPGDQYLSRARDILFARFLQETDADTLFFLDDDIGWDPAVLTRFLCHPVEVVGGAYPLKVAGPADFPVVIKTDDDGVPLFDAGLGLIPAARLPTGFLRISRRVCEFVADHPATVTWFERNRSGQETRKCFEVFRTGVRDHPDWTGEDFDFCITLQRLGIDLWLDPEITFSHTGQMVWISHYGNYLRSLLPPTQRE